ncbi:MAG TPA: phospholipase D-like domain-containing protein [Bryobacteraceae bacterium]|nr:phospholipase D-like domain-containing protein [Bryobacteraceae bacterium]
MKLLVQPGDGVAPFIDAINRAQSRVEIVVFRFDRAEIENALANAAARGVFVHALIAYTNRGGERNLRKLEMRLLEHGITVARTADGLARYHDKFLIVDRRELFLLSFNFTHLDIEYSRCFGVITRNPRLVAEAVKLFEADTKRQPYQAGLSTFVVSPVNARKQLAAFLSGAKKQLLIYDPEISDPAMLRVLEERAQSGVEIKVIGRVRGNSTIAAHKLTIMRLHTRTIIRDGSRAFIGSQSLRELELNARRELGIVFRDKKIAAKLAKIFQSDWEAIERAPEQVRDTIPQDGSMDDADQAAKVAKKVAKAVTKDLPPVAPMLRVVVRELVGDAADMELDTAVVEESVKEAVKDAVRDAVESAVEHNGGPAAIEPAEANR